MPERQSLAAEVLGIRSPHQPLEGYITGYQMLMGIDSNPLTDPQELARDNPKTLLAKEVARDVMMLERIIRNKEIQGTNTLTDWPSYADMMDRYGTRATGASALMIGSLTPMSSRAFVCAANTLYGVERAYIVDPQASAPKTKHGMFIYGDGLQLPIQDGTMSYVHTNRLLHMLSGANMTEPLNEHNVRQLFSEVSRVMPAGGQLLMVERAPGTQDSVSPSQSRRARDKLSHFIANVLPEFGFAYVEVDVARHYNERKFLHDPKRRFRRYHQEKSIGEITVFAQKSPWQ